MLAAVAAVMMVCGFAGCGGGAAQPESENPVATEMQAELQSYAADLNAEAAAEAGMFTIENGAVVGGQENWDAFMAEETESVILCQFTMKGGAMLDYVQRQEDGSYLIVSDLTRDGYEYEEKEDYKTQCFTEVKVFDNFIATEGGISRTLS